MTKITKCRVCEKIGFQTILSFGEIPLANSLLTLEQLDQPEKVYPLDVVFCPHCSLLQITETVDPNELFGHYLYFSSFSDTMIRHAADLAQRLSKELNLDKESLVLEIASNDGYLLKNYHLMGIPVLGVEPASNIAEIANQRGITTRTDFFNLETAQKYMDEGIKADVIHAHNVLAHVADLNGVAEGFALLLKPTGTGVIEVPYVGDLIERTEFDTVYHEHLCYFSLTALNHLFRRHLLCITNVERIPIHGGSLRIFVGWQGRSSSAVSDLLAEEKLKGMIEISYYSNFGDKVALLREELCELIADLKRKGATIAVYGASAKGNTLLNYFKLGRSHLDFVVDRSVVKQGLYTPGTHLIIYPPEKLLESKPDYVLLLTWNFADEILAQQAAYRQQGGKFILPIPEVKIV